MSVVTFAENSIGGRGGLLASSANCCARETIKPYTSNNKRFLSAVVTTEKVQKISVSYVDEKGCKKLR